MQCLLFKEQLIFPILVPAAAMETGHCTVSTFGTNVYGSVYVCTCTGTFATPLHELASVLGDFISPGIVA